MALNKETIYAEYQAALKELEKRQRAMAGTETPETFRARLERELTGREIAPGIAREEREVLKKLFTSPRAIEERLGGIASPLQAEQVISQRQRNWIDQLGGLQGLRESKQDELKDIIADVALGYKAEAEAKEQSMQQIKDQVTQKWREYQQAYNEYQDRVTSSLFSYYGPKQEEARKKLFNEWDVWFNDRRGKDGFSDVNDWLVKRQEFINQFGKQNIGDFYARYPVGSYVNMEDPVVANRLQEVKDLTLSELPKDQQRYFDPYINMGDSEKKRQLLIDTEDILKNLGPEAAWDWIRENGFDPSIDLDFSIIFSRTEEGKKFIKERR
jgi:hypothetical protein